MTPRNTIHPPGRARDRLRAKIDKLKAEEAACVTTTSAPGAIGRGVTTSQASAVETSSRAASSLSQDAPAPVVVTTDAGTTSAVTSIPPTTAAEVATQPAPAIAPPSSSPCPPEWYSIGSSDIAALMGTSPHSSAVDVWARLVHGVQQPEAAHMTAGKAAEKWVLMRWQERTGFSTRPDDVTRGTSRGVPVRAQRDAVEIALGGTVEIKAPTRHLKPWEFDPLLPPWKWRDQVIWQMGVVHQHHPTRRDVGAGAWIVAEWGYHEGDRREWYVPWDDAARARFALQLEVAADCWQAWIVEGYAPEPRTADEQAMIARLCYPRITQPVIARATADESALLRETRAAKDTEEAAKAYAESCEARLSAAIGDREGLTDGTVRATWRANKKGTRVLLCKRVGDEADGE